MTDADLGAKDARRLSILDAATTLLAAKPTASLADIAAAAHIGKATLHRYFPSREVLLVELAHRALALTAEVILNSRLEADSVAVSLRRLVEALLPLGDKLYFLLNEHIWDVEPSLAEAEQVVQLPVMRLLQRGQAEGSLRPDLSLNWLMYFLNYTLYGAWQAIHDGVLAKREAPQIVVESILRGITRA